MADKNLDRQHNLAILAALDEAIEKGPWDTTVFFQAMRNRLVEIRDRFKRDARLDEPVEEKMLMPATLFGRVAKRSGLAEVFVLLYNAQGSDISKWEGILHSIGTHIISRPVYYNEKDAKSALRLAQNKANEAYAAVFIHEEDILPSKPDRVPRDRHGNEILIVKEGVIRPGNIHRFVHISGFYDFKNDKLIKQGAADFL